MDGIQGYELYDHKFDKEELNNLSNDNDYKRVKDSLRKYLSDVYWRLEPNPLDWGGNLKMPWNGLNLKQFLPT